MFLLHSYGRSRYQAVSYRSLSRPFTSRFLKPSLPSPENSEAEEDNKESHQETNNTAAEAYEPVKVEK